MGNLLGFQYLSAPGDDAGPGLLRFFRCLGLGRWLLLRFPSLYRQLDGLAGPHSLLLSGTSWAPSDPDRYHVAGAPGYHLQLPVSGVLSVPEGQLPGLDGSRFYVAPQRQGDQAIIVSGQSPERRPGQLQLLVTKLAEPATGLLDRVLAQLPQQRQRVLLLVGSYDEVDLVADHLFRQRRDLSGAIVRLIADSEDETRDGIGLALHRGQVGRLASTGGRVLVAPLLAIERGHNILNEAGEAALGAVMFLVRPMPVPGDLAGPLHAVNAWAISHMEDQAWFKLHTGDPVRLGQAAAGFRKKAADLWRERLVQWGFLATKSPEERAELYWSQWIVHWQAIGRLLRGGVPAQVYFCDGAYVPNTARGRGADTVLSSVLAGYEDVLAAIAKHPIAERLYGPAIRALAQKELLPW